MKKKWEKKHQVTKMRNTTVNRDEHTNVKTKKIR